ncbi:PLP-dependent aminotransferase family protein [Micromonospora sp. HM5-17]|uniref:aminotransferase-like domain-containing protein n=1 Tax=Micromonospora sp. HM5-17 TaxID=2487710 RepID=UPI000F464201|nr:PLP-dependent aminotransferase family protein [Micromonospora sp. HM5-17]ROT31284.1 PLP-dependent aminotransferase family protein [Micromonospora sp. HM5-17]
MDDYRRIADRIAADIAAGRLTAGQRLPTQRAFARQRGIAASTAARVYAELARRGLVTGEVGRGTFVRASTPPPEPALAEPADARVDLELSFSVLPDQPALQARALASLVRPDALAASLSPIGAAGTPAAREAAAHLLDRPGWAPDPDRLLFTGNGRQAIAAAIAALVPVGERLGVEALTYPVVKALASRLGVTLVPLPVDGDGLLPEAVAEAHRAAPLRAIYVQPTLHNPLGTTMPAHRRTALADLVDRLGIFVVEDAVWSFLTDAPAPLAALAPSRTVLVDSLSKRLAPGLTVGVVAAPPRLTERLATAIRSGAWTTTRFGLDATVRWIGDGTVAAVAAGKRRDARGRQELVRDRLAGYAVRSDPGAYHCWWELPAPWRADTFVAAAARRGIAVTPAAAFTIGTSHAPNAVRLALATPPLPVLAGALDTLAALARATPEDMETE